MCNLSALGVSFKPISAQPPFLEAPPPNHRKPFEKVKALLPSAKASLTACRPFLSVRGLTENFYFRKANAFRGH
jgi:hypothetical protein